MPNDQARVYGFHEAWSTWKKHPLNCLKRKSTLKVAEVEVMAKRGIKPCLWSHETSRSVYPDDYTGPRGLKNPRSCPAVRIMRLVALHYRRGFQTHLKWGEQKRVFQMTPGLENVLSLPCYGVMHRNFIWIQFNLLEQTYRSKKTTKPLSCWSNDGCRRLCWSQQLQACCRY